MLKIAVIDAQGGGFGKSIVESLTDLGNEVEIFALGTNVFATMTMKKAGAHRYATGENAICFNADKVDLIMGGIGIIAANAMSGEITPLMAQAISSSHAKKILIPFGKCNISIPGTESYSLKDLITIAVKSARSILEGSNG